tara:strand:+ start:4667 stop:4936 length:270 start_codon:yes stop_codon:yes gene_type:complete
VGLIKAILALILRAFPMERLFMHISDKATNAKAAKRYEDKLDAIDNAILRLSDDETKWDSETDGPPTVSIGGESSTGVHTGSTERDSET